jgi:hypothetical protein
MTGRLSGTFVVALVAAACSSGGLACGSDKSDTSAESKTEAKQSIRPVDNALAKRVALTLSDFPTGWRQELSKNEDEVDLSCPNLDFSRFTVTGKAESPDFSRGENTQVSSKVGIFETDTQAREAFLRIASDSTARCLAGAVEKEFKKSAKSEEDFEVGEVSMGRVSAPRSGDRSADLQITIPIKTQGLEPDVYLDLAPVQQDRALSIFIFVDVLSAFDEDLKQSLIQAASARMPGSPAKTPSS